MTRLVWLDGALVPWERATVHVMSHSLQRGSLVFDHMSVHETPIGRAVFRMEDHLRRLERSAALVQMPLPLDSPRLAAGVLETVRANPEATAVRICAYLPSIEVDVVPMDERVSVAILAFDPLADVVLRTAGRPHLTPLLRLRLVGAPRRTPPDVVPPEAKVAANYCPAMIAKWAARREGYDEILLLDREGHVAEASTQNLFLVDRDGVLRTPALGHVLDGVTRRTILDLARHDGIATVEETIEPEALFAAAEVFLTTSSVGVWPVVSIDERSVGRAEAGPVTCRLLARLDEVTSGRDAAFASWLTYVDPPPAAAVALRPAARDVAEMRA